MSVVLSCRLRLDQLADVDSDVLGLESMLVQVLLQLFRGLLILRIVSYEVSHGHIELWWSCCERSASPSGLVVSLHGVIPVWPTG